MNIYDILMFIVIVVLLVFIFIALNQNNENEKQILARKKAYKYAYYASMIVFAIFFLFYETLGRFMCVRLQMYLGMIFSLTVFMLVMVLEDGLNGMNVDVHWKRTSAIMIIIGIIMIASGSIGIIIDGVNLQEPNKIGYVADLFFGAAWTNVAIVYVIKKNREKH